MTTVDAEIKVTLQTAAEHGLTSDEYSRIQKILGRDPNLTELGIFSVMWSEHCSYKSSRVHSEAPPNTGPARGARARGKCRRRRYWRRPCRCLQNRIPQPSQLRRTIPRRSHRRRWNPARHLSRWARVRLPSWILCDLALLRRDPQPGTQRPGKLLPIVISSMASFAASDFIATAFGVACRRSGGEDDVRALLLE